MSLGAECCRSMMGRPNKHSERLKSKKFKSTAVKEKSLWFKLKEWWNA